MSKGGNTTTVQKADPWSGQQPYLKDVFKQAQQLDQNYTPQYYPHSTVAPFNPTERLGLNMAVDTATNDPLTGATGGQLTDTLNGNYLDASSNPYLQGYMNSVASTVTPALESQFNQGGNGMNSSLASYGVSQGLSNALANTAYQNYSDERTNQLRAALEAPSAQTMGFTDANAVQNAGQQQQTQAQNQLSDLVNRFNFGQQLPYNKLNTYDSLINGTYGGTTTTTQPYYTNMGANALSGGIGGAMLGSQLLGPALGLSSTAGGGIGAGLGMLLGLL